MQTPRQEPIIIELDEPTPRWFRFGAIALSILIVALVIAPWFIDVDPAADADASGRPGGTSGYDPVCQPRVDIPSFAEPAASVALPSWMRLCDWFIEPGGQPIAWPSPPETSPFTAD